MRLLISKLLSQLPLFVVFVGRVVLFCIFVLFGLEIFFRLGIHAKEYPRGLQDSNTCISCFDESWVKEGLNSFGPLCKPMGHWRINNEGWNSVFDYSARGNYRRPRIAILGNSYIEGWAADVESHIDAELYSSLNGEVDVYVFGISGATFAQYLGMMSFIENTYDPDVYLLMLSSFGIERSLNASVSPYRFYLDEVDSNFVLSPPREIYHQNRVGRVIFRSALARYLKLNKQIFSERLNVDAEEMVVAGEVPDGVSQQNLRAGNFFLESFAQQLPGDKIIFFADGNRDAVYSGSPDYQAGLDYRILDELLDSNSVFELVDLTSYMAADFSENRIRFSRDYDPHWNNYAHKIAAEALLPYVRSALTELGY